MSCRPRHSRFDPPMALLLDCLIHDSSEWGHVSMVYSPGAGPKGSSLVRFYVIKKIIFFQCVFCQSNSVVFCMGTIIICSYKKKKIMLHSFNISRRKFII